MAAGTTRPVGPVPSPSTLAAVRYRAMTCGMATSTRPPTSLFLFIRDIADGEPRRRFRRPGREAAHWIWTGCGSMVWFLDVYTQFSTARGDQCQQRKNLAPNRKSSRRVIWTGDPCETDTILTSMVEANAFTLQGWGRLASLC